MKHIMLSDDIRPVSEFRANTSGFIAQVHETRRPLVLTQNGKSAAVLLDASVYDAMVEKLELLQDIGESLGQVRDGKAVSHSEARHTLKARYAK